MALLEVSGVTVRFGGVVAVDDASLSAEAGRVTGLIGPNGAGKTTLFNVITGLLPATAGSVVFDGRDLTRAAPSRRARAGMGRTFQRLEAFGSLSVRDNVLVASEIHAGLRGLLRRRQSSVDDLLARVGIAPYAGHRADAVPTGVARLLEMARVLAIDPRLLLLDEPSSGLDESETAGFGSLLRELAGEGRGVLLVEHDMGLVMNVCDVIHVLEFGRIIASGTPEEIRADRRVQEAYLGASPEPDASAGPHDTAELPLAGQVTEELSFPGRHREGVS
ncbi:MAG: ABC transporter ATP-binding protein [Micromonosporaceae bacterium]